MQSFHVGRISWEMVHNGPVKLSLQETVFFVSLPNSQKHGHSDEGLPDNEHDRG